MFLSDHDREPFPTRLGSYPPFQRGARRQHIHRAQGVSPPSLYDPRYAPRRVAQTLASPAHPAPGRPNLLTLVSVAVVAVVAADMVHETLGHGLASWLLGDRVLSIPTVALQNADFNRFVASAGTLANCIVGAISLSFLSRAGSFSSFSYFLWLFGAFNLFNSCYFIASAALNSSDWTNVIAGLSPPLLWRVVLGLAGVAAYGLRRHP